MDTDKAHDSQEFLPATQTELSRFVQENATAEQLALCPVGGRTSLNFGCSLSAPRILVDTTQLSRTVDYPVRDMTITVEAGVRIEDLQRQLLAENQWLPIDIPQSHRATLGGAVATDTSGPRRFGYGTFRDVVVGISAVDANGCLFKAGGRVVKNVAGYDLCKLLIGSLGTLAIVTQMTLKLYPIPETSLLLWLPFESFAKMDDVLDRLVGSQTRPVALEVLEQRAAVHIATESRLDLPVAGPVLCLGYEGLAEECQWQVEQIQTECAEKYPARSEAVRGTDGDTLWSTLTEYPTFSDDPLSFEASLLPSQTIPFVEKAAELGVAVQAHAGNGIVVGHLPDDTVTVEEARQIVAPLRQLARQHQGHLVIVQCQSEWKEELSVFGEPAAAWNLMRELKRKLDPENLLNPGRFIPDEQEFTGANVVP